MRGFDWDILGAGLVLCALVLAGCGPGAYDVHVDVVRAMHDVQTEAEPIIRRGRVREMTSEAQRIHDAGGDRSLAEAAAAAAGRRWTCAVEGHRAFGLAVGTYADELELAMLGDDPGLTGRLVSYALKVVDAWRLLASCVGELAPGTIPEVPSFLNLFPPSWRGGADR